MLSEAEQRRLAEIETLLRGDDPGFVRRFDVTRSVSRRWTIVSLAGFVAAVVVTVVALLAGSVLFAVLGLSGTGAAAGTYLSHRARSRGRATPYRGDSDGSPDSYPR
jgi:hypothetical protein